MSTKAEDESGLTPVEDDNVGRRKIYRKNATISRTSDYNTDIIQILRFGDLPADSNYPIPEEHRNRIMQCTLKIGDDFIRLSDCNPDSKLNDKESERITLAMEAEVEEIKHAFEVLCEDGRVGMELTETFYSPCAGIVFDKFGIMWNLSAIST